MNPIIKKIKTTTAWKFHYKLGKFHNVRDEEFETPEDVYNFYVNLVQMRGNLATLIRQGELELDGKHRQMLEIDEEIKRIDLHMPEILKAHKKEVKKIQDKRDEDLGKGAIKKPLVDKQRVTAEVSVSEPKSEEPPLVDGAGDPLSPG